MNLDLRRRPRTVATVPLPAGDELERMRSEAMALAEQLGEATRRLKSALDEKERLSQVLDQVLENVEAGVVLCASGDRVLAANAAARATGVVRELPGAGGRYELDPALTEGSGEALGLAPIRPHGLSGPSWVARRNAIPLPGGAVGRLLTVHDVSAAVKLQEQAARRTRLEALGRMAAEIAHEVRNPLGSLELFSALLVDELQDRADARELAEQILLGVRHLSGTVTHLLAAVRGRPACRRALDAAALARETCAALAPIADARGVVVEPPSADAVVPVAADLEALRQALLNLVGNALDVTPEPGVVRVVAARRGSDVVVEVHDSGPGVPEEMRERIFEPFFTTRREGTGLGLAVVERVALSHGGAVEVRTSPLGGALFRIVIPDDPLGLGAEESPA